MIKKLYFQLYYISAKKVYLATSYEGSIFVNIIKILTIFQKRLHNPVYNEDWLEETLSIGWKELWLLVGRNFEYFTLILPSAFLIPWLYSKLQYFRRFQIVSSLNGKPEKQQTSIYPCFYSHFCSLGSHVTIYCDQRQMMKLLNKFFIFSNWVFNSPFLAYT